MLLLAAQPRPSLLASCGSASGGPGKQARRGRACRFCAASRLRSFPGEGSVGARRWRQFAMWYRLGRIGLRDEGARLRPPRGTSCVLVTSAEPAADAQPRMEAESLSTTPPSQSGPNEPQSQFSSNIALPPIVPRTLQIAQLSMVDQAFLLLGFIACSASFALFALIVTAIPTLHAMRKAAMSMEKLADVAREELPGTMAAIRLSGMEISDLTLELNDLSQEISDGVRNSSRAVQAAEVGIRRLGAIAASQTFALLQETASVPVQVVRPAVVSAAATTLHAVSQAQKLVLSLASSSYPHISGWLGQKGIVGKRRMPATKVSAPTATLTELLVVDETPGGPLLSDPSLFNGTDGKVVRKSTVQ